MTKKDFLTEMQRALSGKVPAGLIQEMVRYYDDYISMKIRKGEAEEAVLDQLGEPRLLARSIAEANGGREPGRQGAGKDKKIRSLRIPVWLAAVLLAAAVLAILGILAAVSWLLPVLLPAALIAALLRRWQRGRK